MSGKLPGESAQGELIPVGPESAHDSDGRGGEHRVATFGFAGVHIRHVHFDEWHGYGGERIAYRDARVRVGAGVDYDSVNISAQTVNRVDQVSFTVVLRERQVGPDFARRAAQSPLDVGECLSPIELGLAAAEEVQVRAIDDGNPHVFFNPLSHALNCATSSVPSRRGGTLASLDGFAGGGDTFASPAKN